MNNIEINSDNLSRFNKRLQKALKNKFDLDIKLADASNLFAQALGKDTEYELKKVLSNEYQDAKNNINPIDNDSSSLYNNFLDGSKHLKYEMNKLKNELTHNAISYLQSIMRETGLQYIQLVFSENLEYLSSQQHYVSAIGLSFYAHNDIKEKDFSDVVDRLFPCIYDLEPFLKGIINLNNDYNRKMFDKLKTLSHSEIKKLKSIEHFIKDNQDIFSYLKRSNILYICQDNTYSA